MCASCGCGLPGDHGDRRNITVPQIADAAAAAGITPPAAAANMAEAVAVPEPVEVFADMWARPVILCDIDGVLARWADAANAVVNARYGTSYAYGMWATYHGPLKPDEHAYLVGQMGASGFWAAVAPDTAAIDGINALAAGHVVAVASERDPSIRAVTSYWLAEYGVRSHQVDLLGAGGKPGYVAGWVRAGRRVVVIDDNPARWVDIAGWDGVTLISPRCPWTPDPAGYRVAVVDTWDEIAGVIAAIPSTVASV